MTPLETRYMRKNPSFRKSIVELRQVGDFLFVLRKFKDGYYLARTRWSAFHGKFIVDLNNGDFQKFSQNLKYLRDSIPTRSGD